MLQKSGRLVLWEAMFILELHSAETQGAFILYFPFQSLCIPLMYCKIPLWIDHATLS